MNKDAVRISKDELANASVSGGRDFYVKTEQLCPQCGQDYLVFTSESEGSTTYSPNEICPSCGYYKPFDPEAEWEKKFGNK